MVPTHLTTSPPARTFRYIATWAQNAADTYDEIDEEYDPDSERVVMLRNRVVFCAAHVFAAVVLAHPDARWRIARGLDKAQKAVGPVSPPEDPDR